jgi:RHS repeat-associated protein
LPTSGTYAPPASGEPNTVQGVLANVTFTYDAVGNPKTTTDTSEPAQWPDGAKPVTSRTMTYDNAYRLASSKTDYAGGSDTFVPPFGTNPTYPAPTPVSTRVRSQTFTYDWLGNTSQSDDDADIFGDRSYGVVVNGAMGAANGPHQLISTSKKSGNQNATYDASGNLATLTVHRLAPCRTSTYNYSWNEVGRLETADRIDGTNPESAYSHYAYDADGNRVTRVTAPNRYEKGVWSVDVFDSLRLEHASYPDAAGDFERTSATESVYLVSNGERMAHVVYAQRDLPTGASGRVHVFLEFGNYLGTTSFVVDRETSELVERASYQAYGAPDSDYRPARWDAFHEAQGYSGKEDDSEVGLTYFGARYYVASIGRWASPDPLAVHALGSDPNPYAYVLGSPTRFTDPSGLSTTDPNAPGCDNLNVGCGSGGLGDFGGLFGFLGGDGGGGGAGPIRSNGSPGAFSRPGYLGGSSASPIVPLAGPRMASVFGDFTVNMGAVRAFNTGVERNSTVLVAVAAVAAAQVAVIAAVAEEAAGLVAMSRISASWANLGRLIGVWSPLAVAVSSKATELISGLNGNSYVVAGEGLVASDGINAPRLAAQLIHEEASSAFTATGELSPEAIEGAKQIFSPGELSNPAIPAGFAKYSTETFGSPSGPFQVHFYMEPLRGEIHYALDYKAVFNGSNGIQPFRAFRGSAP